MTNQSELDEMLTELRSGIINFDDRAKQAILDWHNKQVEEVLDRLEDKAVALRFEGYLLGSNRTVAAIPTFNIEAERNMLKESK